MKVLFLIALFMYVPLTISVAKYCLMSSTNLERGFLIEYLARFVLIQNETVATLHNSPSVFPTIKEYSFHSESERMSAWMLSKTIIFSAHNPKCIKKGSSFFVSVPCTDSTNNPQLQRHSQVLFLPIISNLL